MAFGNGTPVERRKTSHINDNFRRFLRQEVSRSTGLPVSERQAMTLFKILMKAPLRFMATLDEDDFDQHGERALAVTGIGKYKIIDTVAQGKKKDLVGDNPYPRFKFYPSAILEQEVEILTNLENVEARTTYDRTIKNEEYNINLCIEEMTKYLGSDKVIKPSPAGKLAIAMTDFVKDMIHKSLANDLSNYIEVVEEDEEETTEEETSEDIPQEEATEVTTNCVDASAVANALDNVDFT